MSPTGLMPKFFWTPHSGYHWDGAARRFFEGWYVRLTLPHQGESFSFMYSVDDPAGDTACSGGAIQILGPAEQYFFCRLTHVDQFWAWRHRWGAGHWQPLLVAPPQVGYLSPEQFWQSVKTGYQLTATHHQGCMTDDATGAIARWDYTIEPVYGWGPPQGTQLATAGWLSYLPIFEPGWQVLMAHGWATGWAEWQGQRYDFERVPIYAEKNWGGAFPQRWFWLQANAFKEQPALTVTAVGGRRQVFGRSQTVGLVGVHFADRFINLDSLTGAMTWHVTPWGHWHLTVANQRYRIVLAGRAATAPTPVQVPTLTGLRFECWDTTHGDLTLQVWERSHPTSAPDTLLMQAMTSLAALEVGGQGWEQDWHFHQPMI